LAPIVINKSNLKARQVVLEKNKLYYKA